MYECRDQERWVKSKKEVLKIMDQKNKEPRSKGKLDYASLTRVPVTRVLEL